MEAQTVDFYTNITNLWYLGQKTEVLALGEQRLNVNSNDMAGVIIKLEYEEEFVQLNLISNTLNKINFIGETITNKNFQACYPDLKESNDLMLEFLKEYHPTPAEIIIEQAKSLIPNKPFALYKELEALQKDGLCEPLEP